MPRSKKITSDNRDALEILREAFVDAETPRMAELETRKKRTRTVTASDPYKEPIAEDVPAKISKKLAVEHQTRGQQPTIIESQDIPQPFWTETPEPEEHKEKIEPSKEHDPLETWENEGGATPQERLKTIEEQTKMLPPQDREEFEKLTAQIKAQFDLQDQKGMETQQQATQSVPPPQLPKQFAEKPQPNEMNKHLIPEGLARSAIAMGLKDTQAPNEDKLDRQKSEEGTTLPEKAPDLGNVEAQLKENMAKINGETKVLTQEEADAILASAPKEELSKTEPFDLGTPTPEEFEKSQEKIQKEDEKTEAGHKARMRSPKPLSPEDLPEKVTIGLLSPEKLSKEPAPPQNNPPETEQKKSEETKAAQAWAEWTAKETEKEKQQMAADKKTADEYEGWKKNLRPEKEARMLNPEDLPKTKKNTPAPEIQKRLKEVEAEYKARLFHAGDTALWRTVGPKGVEEYNVLVQGITKDANGKERAVIELPDGKEMTLSFGELFSKEQVSPPLTMPTPEEYDRKDRARALEKEKAALWDEILKTGGTPEQKDRHIALRIAQQYGYSTAAIEEKLKKIDPGMKLVIEELQAAKKLIQTEIDTSPAPQPPENLPVEQHTTETMLSPEKFMFPIGKTGPDKVISKFFTKNPKIAEQYGWDGKSDLKKWSTDPTPEKGGWWHARRIFSLHAEKAMENPEVKKLMKNLGYLKGLSKLELNDKASLLSRYLVMMHHIKEKSSLSIASDASSLDFSSVQFEKAPRNL